MESIYLTSILGNSQKLDGGAMFGNAPRAVWEKWVKVDAQGRIDLSCRCLLVRTSDKLILCETGIGAFFDAKLAERFGVQDSERHILRENLQAIGVDPSDVDYVILSHLHFDHAGGLLPTYKEIEAGDDGLIFPNAKIIVGDTAWQRAKRPHIRDRASFIPGLCEKLEASGRLVLVHPENPPQELTPFLRFFQTEGHTPGQLHSSFFLGDRSIFFAGDLVPGRPWVHLPITMGYDRFPERLIDEKRSVLDRLDRQKGFIFFTHDTHWAAARIVHEGHGKYSTTDELEVLVDWPL